MTEEQLLTGNCDYPEKNLKEGTQVFVYATFFLKNQWPVDDEIYKLLTHSLECIDCLTRIKDLLYGQFEEDAENIANGLPTLEEEWLNGLSEDDVKMYFPEYLTKFKQIKKDRNK